MSKCLHTLDGWYILLENTTCYLRCGKNGVKRVRIYLYMGTSRHFMPFLMARQCVWRNDPFKWWNSVLTFYGKDILNYRIPSGMLTFLPLTPSASNTNGKSDSKLLTVNNRLTKEESKRYKRYWYVSLFAFYHILIIGENSKTKDIQTYLCLKQLRTRGAMMKTVENVWKQKKSKPVVSRYTGHMIISCIHLIKFVIDAPSIYGLSKKCPQCIPWHFVRRYICPTL